MRVLAAYLARVSRAEGEGEDDEARCAGNRGGDGGGWREKMGEDGSERWALPVQSASTSVTFRVVTPSRLSSGVTRRVRDYDRRQGRAGKIKLSVYGSSFVDLALCAQWTLLSLLGHGVARHNAPTASHGR